VVAGFSLRRHRLKTCATKFLVACELSGLEKLVGVPTLGKILEFQLLLIPEL
jgi:hypothetical protein